MDIFTPNTRQAEINAHTKWILSNDPDVGTIGVRIFKRETNVDELRSLMDFDHVIEVREDGTVIDRNDVFAPSLYDDELDSDSWSFFSTGYTGQDSYNGPIMHDSEVISRTMARDILSSPGIYVALVSYYSPEEDSEEDSESFIEGWAIATLN
jgi:hypothetical protein